MGKDILYLHAVISACSPLCHATAQVGGLLHARPGCLPHTDIKLRALKRNEKARSHSARVTTTLVFQVSFHWCKQGKAGRTEDTHGPIFFSELGESRQRPPSSTSKDLKSSKFPLDVTTLHIRTYCQHPHSKMPVYQSPEQLARRDAVI